jgi:hypothetical protein
LELCSFGSKSLQLRRVECGQVCERAQFAYLYP